ncbi:nuclease-related domain-containing protein [Heyndrickxia vini]|uniref:NERD domain-containing protein n=1 Tax=Heyndrickxia vini TaxID=1476025 RepID=A0ABX7E5C1_9BACI|nr:nuclease-related domain-containing protein [Heyndrickxia vini]QQZ10421.1 NERD domain-containing protein [Heyndrickxia vini]
MIVKPIEIPEFLQQLEALDGRLFKKHEKKELVGKQLTYRRTGYYGEKSVEFPLSCLPNKDYLILHNIRLHFQNHYFQIDTLILSRNFFLLLEIKNYYGTLVFDSDFDQFIRITDEGRKEGFENPIIQVERHKNQLNQWLVKCFGLAIPIETLVVISSPRTILINDSNNPHVKEKVIHSANLPLKIQEIQNKYRHPIVDTKQLTRISKKILKEHTPAWRNILQMFNLKENEILTGTRCDSCFHIPMIRKNGKWSCPICYHISKDSHLFALKDYALLIRKTITNKEARNFLHLSSDTTTKRLLQSMDLPYIGENKGRKYLLDSLVKRFEK